MISKGARSERSEQCQKMRLDKRWPSMLEYLLDFHTSRNKMRESDLELLIIVTFLVVTVVSVFYSYTPCC